MEPEKSCDTELRTRFGADPRVSVHAEHLPAAPCLRGRDGSFDLAVSQNVLEHIDDDHAAMMAMAARFGPAVG